MSFLLIQNKGVAPIEGYTLLGMSTSREVAGAIGQFGSGTKHAINLLLRKGLEFYIYCGKNRLEFFYENVKINDGLSDKQVAKVFCRVTGESNRTIDCGWVLDFGAMDWTQTSMALREFISNAIDRTFKGGQTFQEGIKRGELIVKPDPTKRARDGYTRIFVKMDCEVVAFYENLSNHFLHFSSNPENVALRFIPKTTREGNTGPRVYRQGVFIRQLQGKPSAYDYNFGADLKIDESRNLDDYVVRGHIAQAVNQADEATLANLFRIMAEEDVFEAGLDEWYLGYHANEEQKDAWNKAWKATAGDALITTDASSHSAKYAIEKGHSVRVVKSKAFATVAEKMGVKTTASAVGSVETEGEVLVHTPIEFDEARDTVWEWLENANLTRDKAKPSVRCFRDIMQAGRSTEGYFKHGGQTIFVREDVGGKLLLKTVLEECAHYVTGSTDNSRDFQSYLIDLAVAQATAPVLC